jgi:hypothetical protein
MIKRMLCVAGLTGVLACQTTEAPLTDAERQAIADTIRQINAASLELFEQPTTRESFDRNLELWIDDEADWYVGTPAVWISNVGISNTVEELIELWEPTIGTRMGQRSIINNEHFAVLSRESVLHVFEAEFAIKDEDGNFGALAPWVVTQLWQRTDEGWKVLHYHQSWAPAEEEEG